eukprot:gene12894-biopygen12065
MALMHAIDTADESRAPEDRYYGILMNDHTTEEDGHRAGRDAVCVAAVQSGLAASFLRSANVPPAKVRPPVLRANGRAAAAVERREVDGDAGAPVRFVAQRAARGAGRLTQRDGPPAEP